MLSSIPYSVRHAFAIGAINVRHTAWYYLIVVAGKSVV